MKRFLTRRLLLLLLGVAGAELGYRVAAFAMRVPHVAAPPAASAQPAAPPWARHGCEPPTGTAAATPQEQLAALRAPLTPDAAGNPFQVLSWLPPAPPPVPQHPVPAVAPPPPSAPPLPFAFVGLLDAESAHPRVFLSSGDRLLIAAPGDVLDQQYRLEAIAAAELVFTYLPLDQKQSLSTQSEGK
jgi:hypothetical protein